MEKADGPQAQPLGYCKSYSWTAETGQGGGEDQGGGLQDPQAPIVPTRHRAEAAVSGAASELLWVRHGEQGGRQDAVAAIELYSGHEAGKSDFCDRHLFRQRQC